MKTLTLCLLFITVCTFADEVNTKVLKHPNVITIDSEGQVVTNEKQWVVIEDEQITYVGSAKPALNKGAQIIDLTDRYVTPGLMDSHVHTATMPGLLQSDPKASLLQKLFTKQQPKSYLYHGVTQILDPASSPQLLEPFNQQPVRPNSFFCGAVQIVGGYGMRDMSLQEAVKYRPYFIFRPEKDQPAPANFDPSQHSPESVVRRMAKDGASCIKLYVEDGFGLNNDWPLMSMDTYKQLKEAAKELNLTVLTHANAIDMQNIALDFNSDVLAHGMWNWLKNKHNGELPPIIKKTADRILKQGTQYQSTLNVMHGLKNVTVPGYLEAEAFKHVIPAEILRWYSSTNGQWFAREMLQGWGTSDLTLIHKRQEQIIEQGVMVMQYLHNNGHPLLLASDTPPAPTYASQPGLATLQELRRMHNAGVDLGAVFMSATINNAKAFGLEDRFGSVEVGKIANLLVLTSNPLVTVEAYDHIESIVLNGTLHPREIFSAHKEMAR